MKNNCDQKITQISGNSQVTITLRLNTLFNLNQGS